MTRIIHSLVLFLIAGSSLAFAGQEVFEVTLGRDQPNRLVFPVPFKNLIITNGTGIETIKLNDGRALIVRPKDTAPAKFPVTVELSNGDSFTVNVVVSENKKVAVWRYQGAPDDEILDSSALYGEASDKYRWIQRAFTAAHLSYYGREASMPGMSPAANQLGRHIFVKKGDKIIQMDLLPRGSWIGMKRSLNVFQLACKEEMEIETYDFFEEGVVAVSLESDVVSPKISPYLMILSEEE